MNIYIRYAKLFSTSVLVEFLGEIIGDYQNGPIFISQKITGEVYPKFLEGTLPEGRKKFKSRIFATGLLRCKWTLFSRDGRNTTSVSFSKTTSRWRIFFA